MRPQYGGDAHPCDRFRAWAIAPRALTTGRRRPRHLRSTPELPERIVERGRDALGSVVVLRLIARAPLGARRSTSSRNRRLGAPRVQAGSPQGPAETRLRRAWQASELTRARRPRPSSAQHPPVAHHFFRRCAGRFVSRAPRAAHGRDGKVAVWNAMSSSLTPPPCLYHIETPIPICMMTSYRRRARLSLRLDCIARKPATWKVSRATGPRRAEEEVARRPRALPMSTLSTVR